MASSLPSSKKAPLLPASSFYVPSLPTISHRLNQHPTHPLNVWAGALPSDPGELAGGGEDDTGRDAQIYFMMVGPRRRAGKDRLIFWFNGGPGCSSFDGSMMEVGPFRMDPSIPGSIKLLDYGGWEEFSGIVFIDQPPGTGFSYTPTNGYLHELHEASAHFNHFVGNFLQVFPEWQGVDTYLAGESYAGQYIPYFADALLSSTSLPNFPLKGIAIGNGWIDPREQYQGYVDFAFSHKLAVKGSTHGNQLEQTMKSCQKEIDKFQDILTLPINIAGCAEVMEAVQQPFTQEVNGNKVCMNVYDVRLLDDFPACGMNWPPELADVYTYLRRSDVIKALHAESHGSAAWVECSGPVAAALENYKSPASIGLMPSLLSKIQVMLFAGAEDLICNHEGIERTIRRMEWQGRKGMGNATTNDWLLNDKKVGTWTTSRNLTYVKISDSSHMVPYDLPTVAHDMMLRFMNVDFTQLVDGTPGWVSQVGDDVKVTAGVGKMLEDSDKTLPGGSSSMGSPTWESVYNVGSAFIVFLFILLSTGLFFFFRARRRRRQQQGSGYHRSTPSYHNHSRSDSLPLTRRDVESAEEREPLERSSHAHGGRPYTPPFSSGGRYSPRMGPIRGKSEVVFDVGESEDEVDERFNRKGRR
ncbi:kex1 protein [Phaffia rhodozyma]|uniref:Carboxypeptidase n=1 Tax=Phaffia rhodozyma TaxID=264483 RepID=A0A0F7SH36_PHARH|nr:kex1 protein [Phaffia rhodozyma]